MVKSTERVRKWIENHPDERREQNRDAAKRYRDRNKDNPEYLERTREHARASMKKSYAKKRAAMTEEELAAERERLRLKMKAYRERKKAEKLAQQETEKKGTV